MNTATLSKDIKEQMEIVSEKMGLEKQEILNRALLLYFEGIQKQLNLFKELGAWEKLSNESLLKYL
ncbi:MAG: hypothetical protein AAB522_00870 [Patescibacteria group bacterium]